MISNTHTPPRNSVFFRCRARTRTTTRAQAFARSSQGDIVSSVTRKYVYCFLTVSADGRTSPASMLSKLPKNSSEAYLQTYLQRLDNIVLRPSLTSSSSHLGGFEPHLAIPDVDNTGDSSGIDSSDGSDHSRSAKSEPFLGSTQRSMAHMSSTVSRWGEMPPWTQKSLLPCTGGGCATRVVPRGGGQRGDNGTVKACRDYSSLRTCSPCHYLPMAIRASTPIHEAM